MAGRLIALLTVAVVAVACADDPSPRADGDDAVIEVFTVYRGAEAEAFRLVLDEFEAATGFETVHVGTAALADRLRDRVDQSDPPDVALLPQPGLIRAFAESGRLLSLESIDDTAAGQVRDAFPPILDSITVGGELYAVPWRTDVKSLVWYRPQLFEELGYWVPEDFFDLQALVSQMAFDGVTAWCLGIEALDATGWVGTDWIEDIVLRQQPTDVYDEWATGKIRFDDERIRTAVRTWDDLALVAGRSFGTTRTILNTPWEEAGDPLFDEPPGCMMHRQLGRYRVHLPEGVEIGPDGDVDVFVIPAAEPGASAPLLLAGEFAAAFTPKPGVVELLLHLADPRSPEPWARRGGYLSPHLGFDEAAYADDFERHLAELLAEAEVLRFDASDTMPPSVGVGTFWDGVVDFVTNGDLDAAVTTIDAGYTDEPIVSCRLRGTDTGC